MPSSPVFTYNFFLLSFLFAPTASPSTAVPATAAFGYDSFESYPPTQGVYGAAGYGDDGGVNGYDGLANGTQNGGADGYDDDGYGLDGGEAGGDGGVGLAPQEPITQEDCWIVISAFFAERNLVSQQISSFDEFVNNTMQELVDENARLVLEQNMQYTSKEDDVTVRSNLDSWYSAKARC